MRPYLLVQTIQARFDQPGYNMHGCIEALLLQARFHKRDYSENVKQVLKVYSTNLSKSSMKIHLSILSSNVFNYDKNGNIFDIIYTCTYNSLLEQKGSL